MNKKDVFVYGVDLVDRGVKKRSVTFITKNMAWGIIKPKDWDDDEEYYYDD